MNKYRILISPCLSKNFSFSLLPDMDSPRRSSRVSLLELIQSPAGDNSAESTAQRLLQHVAVQLTGSHGQELSMSQLVGA